MERVTLIKEGLSAFGTKSGVYYTNQEIVDNLKELQSALSRGIFEKTHSENFSKREVIRHFEMLAADYGLETSERFLRFKTNIEEMGMTIGTYIKGMAGERSARKALKLLSMDRSIKILYNISIEDGDCQAEYDAIVVAPYGLFVIEVKNWSGAVKITRNGILKKDGCDGIVYDLAGRMGMKEALLKNCLGDMLPKNYTSMVLFSNEKTEVEDDYHRIPYVIGGGVSGEIRLYQKTGVSINERQIHKICECISNSHKEQKTLCEVKCDEIIDDYAHLMAEIENMVRTRVDHDASQNETNTNSAAPKVSTENKSSVNRWNKVAKVGISAIIGIPSIIWAVHTLRKSARNLI